MIHPDLSENVIPNYCWDLWHVLYAIRFNLLEPSTCDHVPDPKRRGQAADKREAKVEIRPSTPKGTSYHSLAIPPIKKRQTRL